MGTISSRILHHIKHWITERVSRHVVIPSERSWMVPWKAQAGRHKGSTGGILYRELGNYFSEYCMKWVGLNSLVVVNYVWQT